MADSPKQAEAAQALFSAIVDYRGAPIKEDIPNYNKFCQTYKKEIRAVSRKVVTPGVSSNSIEQLLNKDKDWFKSSINIANKLFSDTAKLSKKTYGKIKPKGLDLFYVRGDRNVFGSIDKLWKYTNEQVKQANQLEGKNSLVFNNINKWSPADIYLASAKAQRLLKTVASGGKISFKSGKFEFTSISNFVDFSVLNLFIKQMIDDGDLLPLSLKKSPDKKNTRIKTINYIENDVQKALKSQEIGYHGYVFSKTNDVFSSKDVYIKFTNREKILLQFRDKGTSGFSKGKAPAYSYQGIITGGTKALDGGLAGQSIGDVLGQTSTKAKSLFKLSNQKSVIDKAVKISKAMDEDIESAVDNDICKTVFKFVNNYSKQKFDNPLDLFTKLYENKNYTIENLKGSQQLAVRARAQFIFGKYLGGSMINIFEGDKKKADEMVTNMILYAGSRAKSSSPHFKASDISSF